MHIVYRMRGLLGDATEEFIETLDAKSDQEVNNEEVYKMANVMAECRGLEVILNRLSTIEDLSRSRPLLQVLLKLLGLCVKVKHNQEVLTDPKLGSIPILLSTLELCLSNEGDGLSNTTLTEQTLDVSKNKIYLISNFFFFYWCYFNINIIYIYMPIFKLFLFRFWKQYYQKPLLKIQKNLLNCQKLLALMIISNIFYTVLLMLVIRLFNI